MNIYKINSLEFCQETEWKRASIDAKEEGTKNSRARRSGSK